MADSAVAIVIAIVIVIGIIFGIGIAATIASTTRTSAWRPRRLVTVTTVVIAVIVRDVVGRRRDVAQLGQASQGSARMAVEAEAGGRRGRHSHRRRR